MDRWSVDQLGSSTILRRRARFHIYKFYVVGLRVARIVEILGRTCRSHQTSNGSSVYAQWSWTPESSWYTLTIPRKRSELRLGSHAARECFTSIRGASRFACARHTLSQIALIEATYARILVELAIFVDKMEISRKRNRETSRAPNKSCEAIERRNRNFINMCSRDSSGNILFPVK